MSKDTQTRVQSDVKADSKDTISMTVVISKEARRKLQDVKGILGCKTLDNAVSAAMDTISIKDLLSIRLEKEKLKEIETKVLPDDSLPIPNESIDVVGSQSDEDKERSQFCSTVLTHFGISTISEFINSDKLKIGDVFEFTGKPVDGKQSNDGVDLFNHIKRLVAKENRSNPSFNSDKITLDWVKTLINTVFPCLGNHYALLTDKEKRILEADGIDTGLFTDDQSL